MNNSSRFRYLYLREKSSNPKGRGFPVACVAISIDRNENTVRYGVATLHPTDRTSFSKEQGRSLAVGRLMTNEKVLRLEKAYNLNHTTWQVMSDLSKRKDIPTRTKKAVRRWLASAALSDLRSVSGITDEFDDYDYEQDSYPSGPYSGTSGHYEMD